MLIIMAAKCALGAKHVVYDCPVQLTSQWLVVCLLQAALALCWSMNLDLSFNSDQAAPAG